MSREIKEISVREDDGPMGGTIHEHPAFGQITASRIQGHVSLYGSDFLHQHFVSIQISKSRLQRSLSNDWMFANNTGYITVDLSEAQWASFVSSLNVGSGTACTVQRLNGEGVPGLPDPASRKDQFKKEARQKCADSLKRIEELIAMIDGMSITAKAKDALKKQAQSAANSLTNSLPFVLDQFGEHMEETVEKAKTEINAYAVNTVMRAGISALGAVPLPTIAYEAEK